MLHNSLTQYEDILRSIDPLQVAGYLRAQGWQEQQREADRSAIWTHKAHEGMGDDFYEILLPLRPDFRDYARRVAELLEVLVEAEGRSQEEILESLNITNADVVNLRLLGDRVSKGSIPLLEAVRLSQLTWDILQAAACSANSPRAVYSTRKPDRVKQFLEHTRAGQTRRGSYTISIISPVTPDLFSIADTTDRPGAEPFERRVLRFLLGGIQAARAAASAAASENSTTPFEASVERGVSANLCEAIADLVEVGGEGFEVSCQWSPSRQPPQDVPRKVMARRGMEPYLRAAAEAFRANSAIEDIEVRGFVEKASRRTGAARGRVTIVGYVDGQPRQVEVSLMGDVYERAVMAHKDKQSIVCYGLLQREGRGYILKDAYGFEVEQ